MSALEPRYIKLDAEEVERQIARLIIDFPELAEDEALRADVIEGETDLNKVIERALDHMSEADMMVEAIAARCAQQKERGQRYERRSGAMRELIKSLMVHANLKSLPLPEATLTLSKGRETVNIINADDLPQGYTRTTVSVIPNKAAIAVALKAGDDIPGAELKTGEPSITVRRK